MSEPLVVAVMLLHDGRKRMARKAIECFRAQTYQRKRMFILDGASIGLDENVWNDPSMIAFPAPVGLTIGALRNYANGSAHDFSEGNPVDIIVHWDSDDYSSPERMAEQVALLQASGADAVGYREALFWDTRFTKRIDTEAWLYSQRAPNYALGGTLCYWRKTWEEKPFPDLMTGEDTAWIDGLKVEGTRATEPWGFPRFIARIHAGNTSKAYKPELMRAVQAQGGEWKRVSEWDVYCREVMAL